MLSVAVDRSFAPCVDAVRMNTERAVLDAVAVPGRRCYRRMLFAPKPTYSAEVLPGISRPPAGRNRRSLDDEIDTWSRLAHHLQRG
jgi:hypothetical protein